MQEPTAAEMYGIAKKFNEQMLDYPMHTHSAIVEMVRVGMQHRNLCEQADDRKRQSAMQERALQIQEQQVELARGEADRRDKARLAGAELLNPVTQ